VREVAVVHILGTAVASVNTNVAGVESGNVLPRS
jgi:hypothetical protein